MGAIQYNGYRFVPEYSVIQKKGVIHVYNGDQFIEDIHFDFLGNFPEHDQIEELVNHYCKQHKI
ncbi:YbxH family protein [Neobacillus thermocopriae]|uniref:YbxH family protein n=1 Tax=Neobacillus thermocopriae TaxID=1215031 RepID=A0A6B3TT33_9BACI|nr:YbxH family protein [Neobacillus thermocopriae]MED3623442.1 YbxH family protein [Neobacillus thermocopriae]MED3715188.1 YbxH family protein [Neobacillus thermocopriae]NEX80184.1 YbxH family protein [Neobacillus thermocopriae]